MKFYGQDIYSLEVLQFTVSVARTKKHRLIQRVRKRVN
jgi:hypothetical protein